MRPSEYPEVEQRPFLRELLAVQVDPQFEDIRTLLQLPAPDKGFEAGCNLALANFLCSMISGASILFYEANYRDFKSGKARGGRFKDLLQDFYPWRNCDAYGTAKASKLIYNYTRNPLIHSFGVGKSTQDFPGARRKDEVPVTVAKFELPAVEAQLGDERQTDTASLDAAHLAGTCPGHRRGDRVSGRPCLGHGKDDAEVVW